MTEQEFTGWLNSISFTTTEVGMEQKERCRANVFKGWHNYRCQRTAVKDGWCKQHHPDSEKARREAQHRRYEEKMKQSAWYLLAKAKERIQELEAEIARLKSRPAWYLLAKAKERIQELEAEIARLKSRPDDAK